MATIKHALALMKEGSPLTVTRAVASRIGTIVLSVKVEYAVGKESLTEGQFNTIRKTHKLVKDYDKSSPALCYYKLSTL